MLKYEQLRPYQLIAAQFIIDNPASMLGLSMGLGKSVTTLTAIRHLLDTFQVNHVLIVAPKLVAEETWPDEIENWEHTSVLEYELLTGPAEQRENRAKRLPELSIINTENVVWLHDFWGDEWPYDMVVIDEISRFKNPAKRTKPTKKVVDRIIEETVASLPKDTAPEDVEVAVARAIKRAPRNNTRFGAMCKARGHVERIVGLTGTPAPNGLLDIWSQYYLLDRGERLLSSFSKYRSRYFEGDYMGFKYFPRPGAFEQIVEAISDITLSMKTEDYVDLPPVVYNTIKVKLPPKVMAQYKKFEKTLLLEEHDIEAVNNGVLTGKLLQLCIAEGTEVLCERGWVPIQDVRSDDQVWDGVEFVSTKGVKYNGKSNVVVCYGVGMTEDHLVLTTTGWRPAKDVLSGDAADRFDRAEVRLPDGYVQRGDCEEQSIDVEMPVRMRQGGCAAEYVAEGQEQGAQKVVRLSSRGDACRGVGFARHDGDAPLGDMAGHETALPRPRGQGLSQLRRAGDRYARRLVRFVQCILGRCEGGVSRRSLARPEGQQQGVQPEKLPLGFGQGPAAKHTSKSSDRYTLGGGDSGRSCRKSGVKTGDRVRPAEPRVGGPASHRTGAPEVKVYDLIDCGPRNRFVVRGAEGPLIVHNCNGSVYDEDGEVVEIHSLKLEALDSVIEEAAGAPVLVAYSYQFDLEKLRKRYPKAEVVGEAPNLQKRWNAGEIPILLAHPASAGHGLNLQKGGCITVWYGLNWSLELYQQLNKRLHRPGQEQTVFIHHIVAEGTMDERVMSVLPQKEATQDAIIEATKYRPATR